MSKVSTEFSQFMSRRFERVQQGADLDSLLSEESDLLEQIMLAAIKKESWQEAWFCWEMLRHASQIPKNAPPALLDWHEAYLKSPDTESNVQNHDGYTIEFMQRPKSY